MTKSGAIRTAFFFESDIRPLQEVDGVNSKIKHHPLSFGHSPIAQNYAVILQNNTSFARGEGGTRIDKYRSFVISLRYVRQAVANRRRSRLYYPSSSALKFSPPLRLVLRLLSCTYRV